MYVLSAYPETKAILVMRDSPEPWQKFHPSTDVVQLYDDLSDWIPSLVLKDRPLEYNAKLG